MLLINGIMASMLWWPAGLCARLAAGGRLVIRYDHRDTGRSTSVESDAAGYSMEDLASDAVAVLDGYEIGRADIVGFSMGGFLAQMLALEHPERVATLTLIATSALGEDPALPGPTPEYAAHSAAGADLDFTDVGALAEFIALDAEMLAAGGRPFDAGETRALVDRDLERMTNPASLRNHTTLGGGDRWDDSSLIAAPALVVHGSGDPLFPIAHGEALARALPDAELVALDGAGHELHPDDWDRVVGAIGELTEQRSRG